MSITWRVQQNPGTERDAQRASADQVHQIANDILHDAKAGCPFVSGDLYRSGYVNEDQYGNDEIGFAAPYAAAVSDGHSGKPGNPFFTNAIYKHRTVTP